MPIFEFHCQACNQDFEKLVMGSDPQVECPFCSQ
ncbi:MAG: FmdB family zinc ribbon protein, partial [Desulfobaccales bacterium]